MNALLKNITMVQYMKWRTNKIILVVDREVLPALTIQLVVRAPAVCDDCGLLVDVTFDDVQQCFSVTLIVWTHSQKDVPCFSTNSAYNPLSLYQPTLVIFPFTKFTFINFNCQTRTPNQFRCLPRYSFQTNFSAIAQPVCNCLCT